MADSRTQAEIGLQARDWWVNGKHAFPKDSAELITILAEFALDQRKKEKISHERD